MPGTASTARMKSSTVPTVSSTTTSSGRDHGPPSVAAPVAPPTSVAGVRTVVPAVRFGAGGLEGGVSRRRRSSFAALQVLPDSGESAGEVQASLFWRPRRLRRRHRCRRSVLPLSQPLGDDRTYITVGECEHVLPLHIESKLFQLGEAQALETLRQGGGLVPQALAEALFESTETTPPPTRGWAPEDSAEAETGARPLCPVIRGGSSP